MTIKMNTLLNNILLGWCSKQNKSCIGFCLSYDSGLSQGRVRCHFVTLAVEKYYQGSTGAKQFSLPIMLIFKNKTDTSVILIHSFMIPAVWHPMLFSPPEKKLGSLIICAS